VVFVRFGVESDLTGETSSISFISKFIIKMCILSNMSKCMKAAVKNHCRVEYDISEGISTVGKLHAVISLCAGLHLLCASCLRWLTHVHVHC